MISRNEQDYIISEDDMSDEVQCSESVVWSTSIIIKWSIWSIFEDSCAKYFVYYGIFFLKRDWNINHYDNYN